MIDNGSKLLFNELRGKQLSAVTFVQDYLQLWFDGPCINVTNPLTVETAKAKVVSWQPGFRDLLCAQLAKVVNTVEYQAGETLSIIFDDGSCLSISLRQEDYDLPEAYYAHGFNDNGWLAE